MDEFNPYEFLNVPENITLAEFKEFCLPLLKIHHPDKGGNPDHFQKIKKSIKIITDNIKSGNKFTSMPKSYNDFKKDTGLMILPDVNPSDFFAKSDINGINRSCLYR